jgi:WD40 repeat protein
MGPIRMKRSSRRNFLARLAGLSCVAVFARYAPAAEMLKRDWQSRVIEVLREKDLQKPPVITALRLHQRGEWIATAGDDHHVRLWTLGEGTLIHRLDGHNDWVRTIDFAPDGTTLASAGNDRRIITWNAETGKRLGDFAAHPQAITSIRYSHNGAMLAAVGFEGTVRVYEVASKRLLWEQPAPCEDMRTVDFSPDDSLLAAGGRSGIVRIYTAADGGMTRDVAAHRLRVRSLSFSHDAAFIASAGEDRQVRIIPVDASIGDYSLPQRPAKVMALCFYGPQHLATAGSDNQIRLWDVGRREEIGILSGHTGSVAAIDYQANTLVSAGFDTTMRVWNVSETIADDTQPGESRVGNKPEWDFRSPTR